MPQDVYDTPLVSMLEPFVSYSSNKQVEGFDYTDKKIARMASAVQTREEQWNQAVNRYDSLEEEIQKLKPMVEQAIQENDGTINDKGRKLRIQDDAIKMIDSSNSIIVLSIVFILAVCIFLGLAAYS